MEGDDTIFECEMKVVEIRHEQTEMDDKITKQEEVVLKGTDCISVLRRFGEVLTRFNDGEIVKVIITGGK
jgi:hypothetical protein